MKRVIAAIVLAAGSLWAVIGDGDAARADRLEELLMTPCCWQEPVANHRSEAALKMKLEIQELVAAGKTDREILDHYIAQFGPRILVEPEGGLRVWMHIVPVVAILVGLFVAIQVLRKWAKPAPGEAPG